MKNGVPFDVAFSLDDITRTAWAIKMSIFEGGEFDWHLMKFKDSSNG